MQDIQDKRILGKADGACFYWCFRNYSNKQIMDVRRKKTIMIIYICDGV